MIVKLFLTLGCLLSVAFASVVKTESYVTDELVGVDEASIIRKLGKPKQVSTHSYSSLQGTILYPIGRGLFGRPHTDARLLYYTGRSGERYVWLKQMAGKWVVVSDVWIAPGVQF